MIPVDIEEAEGIVIEEDTLENQCILFVGRCGAPVPFPRTWRDEVNLSQWLRDAAPIRR
jgi:hypothetical protein